ncbi:Tyrosine recombinase XerD [Ensifer sp. M14]|uniref:tyrosine-type recombinase/integrase n=1 Tax=Ensifer sp. M14 TaxID=2203782 RepID=UPI000E1DA237|nr:site-specific integrase [Ensifer sp. M14]RDL51835.1 Tyrosine recombinase XerD [Ensifer sp. M14]
MATHPEYPGASSKKDRHGKERWRYRGKGRDGKEVSLPGQPGDEAFEQAYQAATLGTSATVSMLPGKIVPQSFMHAYTMLKASPEWLALDSKTQSYNVLQIETFLAAQVDPAHELTWRDVPMKMMTHKHVRAFLKPYHVNVSASKAKHLLVGMRKLIGVAILEEWIELDPTSSYKITIPPTDGFKAWPREYRERFEAHHKVGTSARTAYALAMWLGNRRGDIANLRWDQLVEEEVELAGGVVEKITAFDFRQRKNAKRTGGKEMFLKVTKALADALAPLDRSKGGTVLLSAYGEAYSEKGLGNRMRNWCEQAGIPAGYTLHGLRKSLGVHLAENGASARQIQDVLGHSSMKESDKYIEAANRKRTATDALSVIEKQEAERAARPKLVVVR